MRFVTERSWLILTALLGIGVVAATPLLTGQQSPATGTPVHMVVTVEAHHGTNVPVSPYLYDLTHRLNHQYLLTFLTKPEKKAGLQRVKLSTEVPNAELVAADHVCAPAGL